MRGSIRFRRLFLRLAILYAKLVPFPQRKWRICLFILSLGGIHPWKNREAWSATVEGLPAVYATVRGFRMKGEWRDTTDLGVTLMGDHQPYETDVVEQLIRPGDTIVDGGANAGFYTLLFALKAGPSGRVYAYEPVSAIAEKLLENVRLNDDIEKARIEFRRRGLGDRAQKVPMYLRPAVSGHGIDSQHSSIVPGFNTPVEDSIVEEIEVVRLDDEEIDGRIDLIKCDIEGAEKAFLDGAEQRIRRDRPLLVLEWSPSSETYTVDEILESLSTAGDYEVFMMRRGRLVRGSRAELEAFEGDVVCATPAHVATRLPEVS